jgi:phosphate-selective porin OprO/OprP
MRAFTIAACALAVCARTAAAQVNPQPVAAPVFGYDDGFFLRTPDGRYELTISGRAQFDFDFGGKQRIPESDFLVRRLRLEFAGRFPGGGRFRFEPNFLPEGTEIDEGWVGFDIRDGNARLMFGRMKAPFGLEERSAQANVDFPRFSILHQFSPQEQHGVFFYGHTPTNTMGVDLALTNGTGASDTNSGKDASARVVVRPCATDEGSTLQHLQLGIAATYGKQHADVGQDAIDGEDRQPVIRFADTLLLDGERTRVGLEAAWYHGPWFAQAEWAHVEQQMTLATDTRRIGFEGAYLMLSHVLTGEDKSFEATRPSMPFDLEQGTGRGAWIVAARYSDLGSDSALAAAGFVEPNTFTRHIRTLSLGLDWVPNEFVIARSAWMHSWYSEDVVLDRGSSDSEDAVVLELQLSF